MHKPINIIISGVGGQGIITLTNIIWEICHDRGLKIQGNVIKGGAQQLGSVSSMMRIFPSDWQNFELQSNEIPPGELDLLIGLEPWETLRYFSYLTPQTTIVFNNRILPIETERYQKAQFEDPVTQLRALPYKIIEEDFTALALSQFGNRKMANFVILERCISEKLLPFTVEEVRAGLTTQLALKKTA